MDHRELELRFTARQRLALGKNALMHPRATGLKLDSIPDWNNAPRSPNLSMRAGVGESPFGPCLIVDSPRGICHLSFFDPGDEESAFAEMRAKQSLEEVARDDRHAVTLIRGIFESSTLDLKLFVKGTPFQLRVWRALLGVPRGALVSYGQLAAAAGNSHAARATGSAVGANPVAFLIPCHRVIHGNGGIGHYRWGASRKRAMLEWEAMRMIPDFDLPDGGQGASMTGG